MNPVLMVLGQTASGKSEAARVAAERLGGEILSLDSMKIYRGMDVGTAKPTAGERRRVPHHLLDLVDPVEVFSTGRYLAAFEEALAGVRARGKVPVVEGGTALYAKALLDGLFEGPPADWELREALKSRAAREGPEPLHAELAAVDPVYAAKIHPHDTRRVVRALEVHRLTGRPLSSHHVQFGSGTGASRFRVVILRRAPEDLKERIRRRVRRMFEAGWIDEVLVLRDRHGRLGRSARQAIGYRAILKALDEVRAPEAEEEGIVKATWTFARRQMTWFKTFSGASWIDVGSNEPAESVAGRLLKDRA